MPEAKWVLRGRIVTNNTSPLYGNNDNIQYVIHEKGSDVARFIVAKHRTSAGLCRNNPHISSACRRVVGGFERWFNLTVVNISEDDADDYTCVGVNAGKVIFGDVCNFCSKSNFWID